MNSNFVVKLALSTAFVAVPSLGCTSLGVSSTSHISNAKAGTAKAYAWARKAEKSFAKGKIDRAQTFAEMAVEADMQNRDYRGLLARIYMAQGRFTSAERTLMDVMELGQVDSRTVVSLALTRIAQGNVESAVSLLDANRSIVPASDYGLTLALAGDTKQAIDILTVAIRDNSATARTRQNLALAYALDGRWADARVMATQDMSQTAVNERIAEWAQYARPGAYQTRVAGLLGVTPQTDGGQPVRLALNSAPSAMAQADLAPAAVEVAAVMPMSELAATGPAPVAESAGFDVVEVAQAAPAAVFEAPLIKAQEGPTKSAAAVEAKPVKLALADVPATTSSPVSGTHLVQLGAFSNAANAKAAWSKFSKRYGVLQGFNSASSNVTVNGKTLIRLAAAGFGNQASAVSACNQIRSQGGVCIVRSINGDATPTRMASRNSSHRIAAR
jgi:D-alanyl-D-alanine carboxypeptidase